MDFLLKYGIVLKNESYLKIALTHTSYTNEHGSKNYERMEFLGDAVLQLVMTDYLYMNTLYNEGEASKVRSNFVCEQALAHYAKEVGYIPYILVGEGQKNDINDTIVADIFESITGAIYLSNGYLDAKTFILKVVEPHILSNEQYLVDYKSLLQELTQTDKNTLEYIIIDEKGPAHDKTFTIEVKIDNIVYGKGFGKSKKEAEQNAAKDAYKKKAN